MKLNEHYYKLTGMECDGKHGTFHVDLLPDCEVYRGHFPGNPVCPGVLNIQTIKECAERLTGHRLRLRSIRRCRLTAIATPTECPQLKIEMNALPVEGGFSVEATLADGERTYMDLKGEMSL